MIRPSAFRVFVAGGGVAGLEALLAPRDLAGARVELTLLSPNTDFAYRPTAVAEPFARGHAARHALADIARDLGVELVRGALAEVEGGSRVAVTAAGDRLSYDELVVVVGARSEAAFRRPLTWTPETDPELFGGLLRDLGEGYTKRVAFLVPPGVAWALPAYELALMTAWQAWSMGQDDVEVMVYTPEEAPLGLFGPRATAALRHDLEEAGVQVETGVYVAEEPEAPNRLVLHPGERRLEAQRIVALPRASGPALPGLAADARGFVLTDLHGKVSDVDAIWAAGDAIAFPVKQGGLAAQQADAAAEAIAAAAAAGEHHPPQHGTKRPWLDLDSGSGDEEPAARHALWWHRRRSPDATCRPISRASTASRQWTVRSDRMAAGQVRSRARPVLGGRTRCARRGDADRERFAARRAEARGKTRRTGLAPDVQSRRTTGGK